MTQYLFAANCKKCQEPMAYFSPVKRTETICKACLMPHILVYFATPYSHESSEIVEERAQIAIEITRTIIKSQKTVIPFTPIAYSHQYNELQGINWVRDIDTHFLIHCMAMAVVMIPGWRESKGIQEEINFCRKHDIPIWYVTPERILNVCKAIAEYFHKE